METYVFRKNDTIGQLDAETDTFLQSCYLKTDIYSVLSDFSENANQTKRFIVGRTGSGKTALLKQLSQDNNIKKYDSIEAESTVFEHIQNNVYISNLMHQGVDLRVFYKSLWLHVLLVKILETKFDSFNTFREALELVFSRVKKHNRYALARSYVETYKDSFFDTVAVTEITSKLEEELSANFSIPSFATNGKASTEELKRVQTATSRYVSSELLSKQKELIKWLTDSSDDETQIRTVISIDDLDRSWLSGLEIRYDFINALLDAVKELINLRSVKFLISIRTDILMGVYRNNLRQEEKDKSFILPITWSREEIKQILDMRIDYLIKNQYAGKNTVHFADVFNFSVNQEPATDFIIERTMLRPRDAIDFVNLSLAEAADCQKLNEDAVLLAEEKFYDSRKKALEKEWVSLYPHIGDYLDSLSFLEGQSFKISSVDPSVKETILNFLSQRTDVGDLDSRHSDISLDFKKLVEVWFLIGVIGIKKTDRLIIYSSFDKPELDISNMDKTFYVHPLFFRKSKGV